MFARVGVGLLCALVWSWAGAQDQDPDLDLIPQAAQQTPAAHSPAAGAPTANQRLYLEDAVSASFQRGGLLVPAPGPPPYDWQERVFFDVSKEWRLSDRLGLTYSGRLNLRFENDLSFPTHENVFSAEARREINHGPLAALGKSWV